MKKLRLQTFLATAFLTALTIISCQNEKKSEQKTEKVNSQTNLNLPEKNSYRNDTLINAKENPNASIYNSKYIEIENSLVNGHQLILAKNKFDALYQNIDSTSTIVWECGSPFEWLDKEWMTKKYGKESKVKGTFENFNGEITTIYRKNLEFSTNNHIVLFDTALAKNNSFKIISHNINLDENTTLGEFKKLFPNAEIEKLENEDEVRVRFYLNKKSDDAFLFYFKNGKLNYFTLWWLLC